MAATRVLKWGIPINYVGAHVPFDGEILPVAEAVYESSGGQHVAIWTVEPQGGPGRTRVLRVFATGAEVPDGWVWRATSTRKDDMVWHVFEKWSDECGCDE